MQQISIASAQTCYNLRRDPSLPGQDELAGDSRNNGGTSASIRTCAVSQVFTPALASVAVSLGSMYTNVNL